MFVFWSSYPFLELIPFYSFNGGWFEGHKSNTSAEAILGPRTHPAGVLKAANGERELRAKAVGKGKWGKWGWLCFSGSPKMAVSFWFHFSTKQKQVQERETNVEDLLGG